MQRRTTVLLAAAALTAGALALWLLLRDDAGVPPAPPPPPRPVGRPAPDDAPVGPAADARVFRSRDEAILLARRTVDGRPLARAAVALLDSGGAVVGRGDTDSRGFWRGPCPAAVASIAIAVSDAPPVTFSLGPPPAPAAALMILDRPALRPGDEFRLLRWDRSDETVLFAVGGEEPVALPTNGRDPGSGWRELLGEVPGDARPGSATIACGNARLEVPILPRWGPPGPGRAVPPVEDTTAGDPALSNADGRWRVALSPPADGESVLVFASAADRFLDHGVVVAEGVEAFVALPGAADGETVEVTAVVATSEGFRVHRGAADGGAGGIGIEPLVPPPDLIQHAVRVSAGDRPVPIAVAVADAGGTTAIVLYAEAATHLDIPLDAFSGREATLRALALPSGRPPLEAAVRLLPDEASTARPRPPAETIYFLGFRVFVPAGVPTEFPSDPAPHPDVRFHCSPVGEPGPGAVRLQAGPTLVLETSMDSPAGGGIVLAGLLAEGALVATSDAPGFAGIVIQGVIAADPAKVSAADGAGLSVGLRMPERSAAGTEFEVAVVLRADRAWSGPVEAHLTLPRGALPAEDGWSIRDRAPAGARVSVDEVYVEWRLRGLPAGETVLPLRLRAAFPGRWAAPPATAMTEDPTGPFARSAGSVLVIE